MGDTEKIRMVDDNLQSVKCMGTEEYQHEGIDLVLEREKDGGKYRVATCPDCRRRHVSYIRGLGYDRE